MLAPAGVPIHWLSQPVSGRVCKARSRAGMTVAEIVDYVGPDLPARFSEFGIVEINGVVVPRERWGMVRPRVRADLPVVVTLNVPLHGGGQSQGGRSKNPVATIASIALLVVAAAATGGLFAVGGLFAAGSTSAALLGAGIGIVGSLAIAALSPPPVRSAENPAASSFDAAADDGRAPASLDGNLLSRGGPIPMVIGWHKVLPPLACQPLVELIGEDEYVEGYYVLAGAHDAADLMIGDTPIDEVADLEYEIVRGLPGDGRCALVNRQGYQDGTQVPLSRPRVSVSSPNELEDQVNPARSLPISHVVAGRDSPDEIWLLLAWQEGLADYSAPTTNIGVPLRLQFRRRGTLSWTNLPEIHFSSSSGLPFQKQVKFKWESAPLVRPLAPAGEGPYLAIKNVPGQAIPPVTGGWNANAYFSAGSSGDVYSASTYGSHTVANISLSKDGVEVFLDEDVFPKGIYEFQATYGTAYNVSSFTPATYLYGGTVYDFFTYYISGTTAVLPRTRAQLHDKCSIVRVTSVWREHPVGDGEFFQVAVRAKNRRIDRLSMKAGRYVRDWNGSDWGDLVVTDNPAPHMVDAMTGSLNADPLPPDLLDNAGLVAWRQACIDNEYRCNAVIEGGTVEDTRNLLASCGYARPTQSELWGVMRDYDRTDEPPVQVFSFRNLSNFRWERAFPRLPDGFRIIFNNADIDYAEDEIVILRDGVDPSRADRVEEVRYAGPVTTAEVEARARYDLAQLTARATFYYGSADIESLVCRRGSKVGVTHDIIARHAGSARIKEVIRDGDDIIGLVLDGSVPAPGSRFIAPNSAAYTDVMFGDEGEGVLWEAAPGVLFAVGSTTADPFLSPRTFLVGDTHAAAIRKLDGTIVVVELQDDVSGDHIKTLTFAEPLSDPVIPAFIANGESVTRLVMPDCLVMTGPMGRVYRDLIVREMRPGKDMTAELVFVDHAPEIWT